MEIDYKNLQSAIIDGDNRYANFFDTFGFIVVRNVIDTLDFQMLLKEYNSQYAQRMEFISIIDMIRNRLGPRSARKIGFKKIILNIIRRPGMRFLPNFVDGSDAFISYFLGGRFDSLYKYFAGENWLYLGSDGSNFVTTSFPWHRDWFTKIPLLKFNFYFNPLPFIGGRFLIIPGSNFTQDTYATYIQKAMSWPMQNRHPGGLAENDRFPLSKNPRDIFNKDQTKFDIPHVQVKLNKGDLVIFDHRCVHAVQNTWPRFQRRLLTVLLSKNAYDLSDKHHLIKKFSREELMSEITDLIVNERNHIGCPPYGEALQQSSFTQSNHFIEIQKNESQKYNKGVFKLMSGEVKSYDLKFDRYSNIGSIYRSYLDRVDAVSHSNSQNFSYENVHLGINAQNIQIGDDDVIE